jgi:hypothetical protein
MEVLQKRRDAGAVGLTAEGLFVAVTGRNPEKDETRKLRTQVAQLRLLGKPIAAHPSKGYYLADSPEELLTGINYLRARALHSLKQINRQKRALLELAGQLRLGRFDPNTQELNKELSMVCVMAEIPEELHGAVLRFLDSNPDWDEQRLYAAAMAGFLMQKNIPKTGAIYLDALLGGKP